MRPLVIVLPAPVLSQSLGFAEVAEDLGVQELIAQAGVEGFGVAVLPGGARLEGYIYPDRRLESG